MKILVFDNYDSFTYNLVHLVEKITHEKVDVYRNDQIPVEKVREYDKIILSPGPGIPEDHLPRIFDRFWQKPGTARHGTGLGLFIVKGIVEAHAGKVWAKSEVGKGSTFFFTLPTSQTN